MKSQKSQGSPRPTRGASVLRLIIGALTAGSIAAVALAAPAAPVAKPSQPLALSIQAGSADESDASKSPAAVLRGPDARLQLVVTARAGDGQVHDFTRQAKYQAKPDNVVRVEANGTVIPLADGKATVTATGPGNLSASVPILVERFSAPDPVNFPNQVVPVFTKLGCNSGGCHGKSGGQNGFKLSLLGFEPKKDYQYLVNEARGRRLFPAAPEQSLLLLKASSGVAHGGGEKLKPGGHEYRVLARWIAQGMPYGSAEDPNVVGLSVYPKVRRMARDGQQQLITVAHYSDGSTQDVTHAAQYEPNNKDMAEAEEGGFVRLLGRSGDVAVMVRYQGQVAVFRATVPLGAKVDTLPPVKNFVDELAFAKLKELGLPPSAVSDDATFLRRIHLDLTGRLPTGDEAKTFLADTDAGKRLKLIDRLLASEEYADFFANKWTSILRNQRERPGFERGNYLFHAWVRDSLHANKPYDQFVRELLTATGDSGQAPAVGWYRQANETSEQVEDTAQLFLGVRIQCARCHHHPFEKWSQDDYYGMAAFFSRVGRKENDDQSELRVFHRRGEALARNPNTQLDLKPTGLGAKPMELSAEDDPRHALADWMVSPAGRTLFAKSLANRYWKHFFGRGIVDPEDDMRETNPPTNPALLDALAQHFIDSKYDLKDLVRTMCNSSLYQLSSEPNEHNAKDRQSYSHYATRRLPAEVLLDAIDQVCGTSTNFNGIARGSRAVQLRDHGGDQMESYFLQVFGRPAGASACECERTGDTTLAQCLHLLNSNDIYEKLATGRPRELASEEDKRSDEEKVTGLYYAALSRPPRPEELKAAVGYVHKAQEGQRKEAWEDVVWALINTKEFLFNH